jgi:hypothetical protein
MQTISPSTTISRLFILLTALTAWVALGLQQYLLIDNTPANGMTPLQAVGRFLLFFTVLSNLLVAISLICVLLFPESKAGRLFAQPSASAAIAVYIFIVGLVYNLVLRSAWHPAGLQKLTDELLHVAVPLLYIIYWILFAVKRKLPWKQAISWLAFPAAYLVYAMARGAAGDIYPYPFIDLNTLGYGQVLLNIVLMLVAFLGVGLLAIAIGRQLQNKAEG